VIYLFHKLGIAITSVKNLERLHRKQREYDLVSSDLDTAHNDIVLVLELFQLGMISSQNHKELAQTLKSSKSQLRQEVFCLIYNNWKKEGFFVEFGAYDGIGCSNTLVLEKQFNWTGILAEPNINFHRELQTNRNCIIETVAIGGKSKDSRSFLNYGNLSSFAEYSDTDVHNRKDGTLSNVEVITLTELLYRNSAPKIIDFLSIDTEGSELEILTAFNFDEYRFNFICVEHNHTKNYHLILDLMQNNGYEEVLLSYSKYDSFFVPKRLF